MRKKGFYVWSLVAALMVTACSSEQSETVDTLGATGTFELNIKFDTTAGGTRASTAIPTTSWSNIKQLQFFLYNSSGNIAFSAIETPASGTVSGNNRVYSYATVPADTYTLVVLANAQSNTDAVTTYTSNTAQLWSVANVYNRTISALDIRHKAATGWGSAITGSATATAQVAALSPYVEPSEVFMGYASNVVINSSVPATSTVSLTREVSLMRARIDQTTNASVVGNVDFADAKAAVMLYNLPTKMGIQQGNAGGISTGSTATNALYAEGFSAASAGYTEGNYTYWKDVVVFPNNGGRVNNAATTAEAVEANKYFIVLCGIAKAGHIYAGGTPANVGDPVFWYGQIKEVFTPNVIREVNLVLETGGSSTPPPGVVEYGGLDITVNSPAPWDSNIVVSTVEM